MKFETGAREFLAYSLASCGGVNGMFFPLAKKLLLDEDLSDKDVMVIRHVLRLRGEVVTVESVLHKFGSIEHYLEMREQADAGLPSIAWEIPNQTRPFFHTFLPVKNGVYDNGSTKITISGLVPFGSQEGELVAHLGAVFTCPASPKRIAELKAEQISHPEFLNSVAEIVGYRYEGTELQRLNKLAKEDLGL